MHDAGLILTLTGGLGSALVLGFLTQRLGLSPIVGYLIAGIVVGPYSPGLVVNIEFAEQLAEIGIILLMFGVGLQFHVEELLAVRRVAIPGAIVQSLAATVLGAWAVHAMGWSWPAAVVFGLALSVASTVVLIRVLSDMRELHTSAGHIAVGWLVVEDLFTVGVLVLLPTLGTRFELASLATSLLLTALKAGVLIAVIMVAGPRLIPRLLDRVAATRSRELFTLTVLVLALGIAVGSATGFGVSMPLGAFLAGLAVGRSDYSLRAATEALPMRDAFAVLFFVSVGMLLDPTALFDEWALVAAALAIVLVGKPLAATVVLKFMGYPTRTIITVATALGQIGEFSFILVSLGRSLGLVPDAAMNVVVAVAIISITINPLAFRLTGTIERLFTPRADGAGSAGSADRRDGGRTSSSLEPGDRAVVVGYGPTGRTVMRLLAENGIAPTIIDLNMDAVRALHEQGVSAVYGDARHPDTLVSAGIRHAGTFIASGADPSVAHIVKTARELNPYLHVFARAAYLRDIPPLRAAGVEEVFSGEGEVALAMTEAVLRRLGATPDQVDRERARIREELFGASDDVPA